MKSIITLYQSNMKLFWERSFLSTDTDTDTDSKALTALRWLTELVFFIPSIIITPFVWTLFEIFNPPPITYVESVQHNVEPVQYYKTPIHSDETEQVHALFETLKIINSDGCQGGCTDFNLAVHEISKHYYLTYDNQRFSFAHVTQASLPITQIQEALKQLFIANKAIVSSLPKTDSKPFRYAFDTYKYIIKPFCQSTIEQLKERNVDEAIIFSIIKAKAIFRDWVFPGDRGYKKTPSKDIIDNAICIQRAYRTHLYVKHQKLAGSLPSVQAHYQEEAAHYQAHCILLEQNPPQEKKTIDHEKLKQWINQHHETLKPLAREFAANIKHRNWAKTERRLQYCIDGFNQTLMGFPSNDRAYIIAVPHTKTTKSNHFMTSFALKYLAKKPENIVFFDDIVSYFETHQHVKHVLFIDDASYSGRQLEEFLEPQCRQLPKNVLIHLAIPFMSTRARSITWYYEPKVIVHRHEVMFTMRALTQLGLLSPDNYLTLERLTENDYYSNDISKRTLYFFDHKIADEVSTFTDVFSRGRHLDGKAITPFVNDTRFRYKNTL